MSRFHGCIQGAMDGMYYTFGVFSVPWTGGNLVAFYEFYEQIVDIFPRLIVLIIILSIKYRI